MNNKLESNLPPWESIAWEMHPVVRRRYTLATPMVMSVMGAAVTWIKNGITGGIIEGNPRLGKTKLRRYLMNIIPNEIPRVLVFSLIARRYAVPSERVFFGDLLKAVGHRMHMEGTAPQRRDRLTESVVRLVKRSGQTRVVLIVDQAHNLQTIQYEWLIDFFDEINEAGVELFVLLVGQRELSAISDDLKRSGKTQIVGRFMVGRAEFFGITTHNELKECLACYDDKTAYPEGTAWSFTRYFFKEAFPTGWRLSSLSGILWKLFSENRAPYSSGRVEIPMQNFVMVVDRILIELKRSPSGLPVVSEKQLAQFVSEAFSNPYIDDDEEEGEGDDDETDGPPVPAR
jgi:hypothetical protein